MLRKTIALATSFVLVAGSMAYSNDLKTHFPDGSAILKAPGNLPKIPGMMPVNFVKKGCTFYENANYGGASMRVDVSWLVSKDASGHGQTWGQSQANLGSWWNDKISSAKCDYDNAVGGVTCDAQLFENANFQGASIGIAGNPMLLNGQVDVKQNLSSANFNDKASSLKVVCSGGYRPQPVN